MPRFPSAAAVLYSSALTCGSPIAARAGIKPGGFGAYFSQCGIALMLFPRTEILSADGSESALPRTFTTHAAE